MNIKSPVWREDPAVFGPLAGHWSTASFGSAADTTPLDLSVLSDHLRVCQAAHERLFGLRCRTDAVKAYLAAHVVTSVLAGCMLAGLVWLAV